MYVEPGSSASGSVDGFLGAVCWGPWGRAGEGWGSLRGLGRAAGKLTGHSNQFCTMGQSANEGCSAECRERSGMVGRFELQRCQRRLLHAGRRWGKQPAPNELSASLDGRPTVGSHAGRQRVWHWGPLCACMGSMALLWPYPSNNNNNYSLYLNQQADF